MGTFLKGFWNGLVYAPVLVLLFLGVIYLVKIYFELRQVRILLKVNESATRDLCSIIGLVEKHKHNYQQKED